MTLNHSDNFNFPDGNTNNFMLWMFLVYENENKAMVK